MRFVCLGRWIGTRGAKLHDNFPDASSANLFKRLAQELCVHRPKSTAHLHIIISTTSLETDERWVHNIVDARMDGPKEQGRDILLCALL